MKSPQTWSMQRLSWLRHHLWWTRAVTLGVRALVIKDRQVFLVRHTYLSGWFLPGGAVDRGESAETAVVRELREEGGIICAERPKLYGLYRSEAMGGRDHVACFVVGHFNMEEVSTGWEIAERGFFPIDALPNGTTRATTARIAEIMFGEPIAESW